MASPNLLTGGNFQDISGNPIANGYLLFELSASASVNTTTKLTAGSVVKIQLGSDGSVDGLTQTIWSNDDMTPSDTFYSVSAYSAVGQLVWGPNAQQVLSTSSPFDIGTWVPGITTL